MSRSVSVETRLLSLPTQETLSAAHDRVPAADRQLVVVMIQDEDGAVGWGECSALNQPTYTSEWAEGAFAHLAEDTADPALHPMAAAAIMMAELDIRLRREHTSLAQWLGSTRSLVPAGAAVGLLPTAELIPRVEQLFASGFGRVKVKIEPGQAAGRIAPLRQAIPDLEVTVDANGSFQAGQLGELLDVHQLGVTVFEQPFTVGELEANSALIAAGGQVVADESVSSLADARVLYEAGALSAVCIKPPRVGGVQAALELHNWCRDTGLAACAGGMLECGLGRHSLAAVASLDGFTLTGDLSPARRWLAADPWPDVELVDGSILVPATPGVAPLPDHEVLDRYTVRRSTRRL